MSDHKDLNEWIKSAQPGCGLRGETDEPLLSVTYASMEERETMWPKRLLYVPEMKSYERQDGNCYGGTKEPLYNIISYTWGRWQDLSIRASALPVEGITWDIPAVQSHIFTADDFKTALDAVSAGVDWVWVDIACIDQLNSRVRDEEVGRQAGIFAGAERAFVWLHQSPIHKLQDFADNLFSISARAQGDEETIMNFGAGDVAVRWGLDPDTGVPSCVMDDTWVRDVERTLQFLEEDPWFSSLWTLQELYLRPAANILSREGLQIQRQGYLEVGMINLLAAWGDIETVIQRAIRNLTDSGDEQSVLRERTAAVMARMDRLALGAADNPVLLYSAAGYRSATFEEDRIYGIMQVYGLKLGKTAKPGTQFSLSELEIQFAVAINEKSAAWGQMFVHKTHQPPGRHWCISQSSWLPECCQLSCLETRSRCSISVDTAGQASFQGLSCSFLQLKNAWDSTRENPLDQNVWGVETYGGKQPVEVILLDQCESALQEMPEELRQLDDERSDRQKDVGQWLVKHHGHELRTFFCGTLQSDPLEESDLSSETGVEDGDGYSKGIYGTIGMLVLPVKRCETWFWRRIGVVIWTRLPDSYAGCIDWNPITALLD